MTIVITGAGSGGHVTPLLAVAEEIRAIDKTANIVFIGQKGDPFGLRLEGSELINEAIFISAGKFRRYHSEGWKQLLDLPTIFKNFVDFFKFLIGLIQAYSVLGKIKPDIIFIKGGYIGVPVGLAAALRKIKYITHDSDTMPGLANRIIAKWAIMHATGMPTEFYDYQKDKTVYVGVPISAEYSLVDEDMQNAFKKNLGFESADKLILFTGGGLGSKVLNDSLVEITKKLLSSDEKIRIMNIAGNENEEEVRGAFSNKLSSEEIDRLTIKGFVTDLHKYSGAADLIISRAGATNIAEFAAQAKACVIIPSPYLVGGHQIKNAESLVKINAIEIIDEADLQYNPEVLLDKITELMNSKSKREELGKNLHKIAKLNASKDLAKLIIDEK
ncbi:MAG: UDP-N-acetylglucosamine--N-acetylmuramyl-(pentapeptide) pyrophosphoryl-undecaprenol N-acetylglucosamine transferase [bacterium]